jgi:hypothetical protein
MQNESQKIRIVNNRSNLSNRRINLALGKKQGTVPSFLLVLSVTTASVAKIGTTSRNSNSLMALCLYEATSPRQHQG